MKVRLPTGRNGYGYFKIYFMSKSCDSNFWDSGKGIRIFIYDHVRKINFRDVITYKKQGRDFKDSLGHLRFN